MIVVLLVGMKAVVHGEILARFGHALSDPTRSRVLLRLAEGPGYPAELAELVGVSRQALSHHLNCLRGCGLVVAIPDGRRLRYELAAEGIRHAVRELLSLVLVTDPLVCTASDENGCC
jgi:DNA-binding transcriptional ArsR family regulator